MTRLQAAFAVSAGLHIAAFAGYGLLEHEDAEVHLSQGETRVTALFVSRPAQQQPPEQRSESKTETSLKKKEPEPEKKKQEEVPIPSPPAEEGLDYVQPAYRRNFPPAYPREAFLKNRQGTVWVLADIGEEGAVRRADVERSSGAQLLDEAAVRAVRQWLFVPAKRAGAPVTAQVRIPVRFEIMHGKPYSGIIRAGRISTEGENR